MGGVIKFRVAGGKHRKPRPRPEQAEQIKAELTQVAAGIKDTELKQEVAVLTESMGSDVGLLKKAQHWIDALKRWSVAGFPVRSMEHAMQCHAICQHCPANKYDASADTCTICGCQVKPSRIPLKSKPRMATEDCPKGHWPKLTTDH